MCHELLMTCFFVGQQIDSNAELATLSDRAVNHVRASISSMTGSARIRIVIVVSVDHVTSSCIATPQQNPSTETPPHQRIVTYLELLHLPIFKIFSLFRVLHLEVERNLACRAVRASPRKESPDEDDAFLSRGFMWSLAMEWLRIAYIATTPTELTFMELPT